MLTLGCVAEPVERFDDELVFGRLDADARFVPYGVDTDGRTLVEVVLGFQGAWMVAMVVEMPPADIGERVDFGCTVETASWSSGHGELLEDVLVGDDGLVYAPFVILGWWTQEPTDAEVRCEVHGPTRIDVTQVDARLIPESMANGAGP